MTEKTEERQAIGQRRAELRRAGGLTQEQLAARCEMTAATISDAEKGGMVRESTARAIAAALGIEVGVYVDPPVTVAPPAPVSP